ncbi:MAG: hypothetical protein ACOCVY_00685 [Patescibacteria group bacterium]
MKKEFKVRSIDKEKVILESKEAGKNLAWPVDEFPKNIKKGDDVILTINRASQEEKEEKILAKNILNEILDIQE